MQGIAYGFHTSVPTFYPVFSKPITNLHGMGVDAHILRDKGDFLALCKPTHFWMEYLTGEHLSTDVAVKNGKILWCGHVLGISSGQGTFDYWKILTQNRPVLEAYIEKIMAEKFLRYTGMVNIESIGGKIIEIHLRMVDQWPDLYGDGWVHAVVKLYAQGVWSFPSRPLHEAYSVVLFGPHQRKYNPPAQSIVDDLKRSVDISSVQITFDNALAADKHYMPPGGFRLAVVNCYNLEVGRRASQKLAQYFGINYPHT